MKSSFSFYLFAMVIITVIFGVIYATVQQTYRTSANDPQIQIARDINSKLQQGKSIDNFFGDTTDVENSLATFVVLYDANGKPLRFSGYLNGKMLELPAGVFDHAKINHEYEVTCQPQRGVRLAVVIVSSNVSPVGFVAVGRSLQEVEVRENNLITMVFLGWIICIAFTLLLAGIQFHNIKQI